MQPRVTAGHIQQGARARDLQARQRLVLPEIVVVYLVGELHLLARAGEVGAGAVREGVAEGEVLGVAVIVDRSEERRVGKECRGWWGAEEWWNGRERSEDE